MNRLSRKVACVEGEDSVNFTMETDAPTIFSSTLLIAHSGNTSKTDEDLEP